MEVMHPVAPMVAVAPATPRTPEADLLPANKVFDSAASNTSVDDFDDFDEDYFTTTYRPLSNLPTPPPSSHNSSLMHSPQLDQGEALEESLLGPAIHLVNMLPPACSLATPSVPLVQAMLTRARLPLDTIALAVCILDSLDSRFARTWRLTCPLGERGGPQGGGTPPPAGSGHSKRHTLPAPVSPAASPLFPSFPTVDRLLHIDAVFPEVIVLAALVIAAKFTDDGHASPQPAQAYCTAWAGTAAASAEGDGSPSVGLWTGAQLAATERCVMQSLGYRILPLLDADLLADARADMRRAGQQAAARQKRKAQAAAKAAEEDKKSKEQAEEDEQKLNAHQLPTPPEEDDEERADAPARRHPTVLFSLEGLGLHELTPPADDDAPPREGEAGEVEKTQQRRHHGASRSECLGRLPSVA